jgi:hypothetical protein
VGYLTLPLLGEELDRLPVLRTYLLKTKVSGWFGLVLATVAKVPSLYNGTVCVHNCTYQQ